LAVAALLAGCAAVPPSAGDAAPGVAAVAVTRDFNVEARFSLRLEKPGETAQHVSGRLSWQRAGGADRLLLANPFGQGLAELTSGAEGAILRLASGETERAADLGGLLAGVLGVALPVERLADWLLARPGSAAVDRDGQGRLRQLREAGWQIEYDYDDEAAGARPSRLIVRQGGEIELRLRIEEWR